MTDQRSYPRKSTEAKGQLHDIADKATDQLKGAAESAMQSAEALTEQAREYGEKAQKVVNQFKPLVEKSLKEQPIRLCSHGIRTWRAMEEVSGDRAWDF